MPAAAALCLLGSVRTLGLECTGATTLRRIARPIGAAIFAFVNVPEQWSRDRVEGVRALIRAMARDAESNLRVLEVDNRSPNSAWKGVPQAKGLRRCWEVVGAPGAFEYIVRVRTDVYHGFQMPERLPDGPPTSVAYVGFLGAPGCSPLRKGALWVDDRFAVLRGRAAQRVFLHDFAASLEQLPLAPRTASQPLRVAAPECLLGMVVAAASAQGAGTAVALRDVRGLGRGSDGSDGPASCGRANCLIVRSGSNCSAEVRAAPWVCPLGAAPPTLVLQR
jgi:hypothetical protein